MAPELHFPNIIRTRPETPPPCRGEMATVEQAIDRVQELPGPTLRGERWNPVSKALWAAIDAPQDKQKLEAAHAALRAALAAEGWLDDSWH